MYVPYALCFPPALGHRTNHLEGRSLFFSLVINQSDWCEGKEWEWEVVDPSQIQDGKEGAQAAISTGASNLLQRAYSRGCHIPTRSWLSCLHTEWEWLSLQQKDFSFLSFEPLTFLLSEFHLCSPGSEDIPAVCVTIAVILPQVEDITASHEAALLQMENDHTMAIVILRDEHDHKVQGSCYPRCVWPAGWAMGAQPPAIDTTSCLLVPLSFLPSFHSWHVLCVVCWWKIRTQVALLSSEVVTLKPCLDVGIPGHYDWSLVPA